MKEWAARIGKILLGILLLAQLARPDRSNPVEDPLLAFGRVARPPQEISAIVERSCADCHSHRTQWPWYSNIAPVSWILASDVNEARHHMNLSEWGALTPDKRSHALEDMCGEVKEGGMPLKSYTWTHSGAKLTAAETQTFCSWVEAERKRLEEEKNKPAEPAETKPATPPHKH